MGSELVRQKIEKLISAGLLEIGDGYRAKNSELGNEGIPFARAANINGGFKFDGADRFPAERLSVLGGKMSRPGDVVFTSKGTVGRFAFVGEATQPFVYSPQLCYWRSLDPKRIYPRYLYFWMQSQEFLHQIGYLKGQTDMADYVSLRDQRSMTLTIPDPEVQKGVSEFLGAVEDRIDLLRQTNATLESITQALFKSWFVDFDPVRAKVEGLEPDAMDAATAALFPSSFEEVDGMTIPEGWSSCAVYDLAQFVNGAAYKAFSPNRERVGLPIVKIAELKSGITEQTAYSAIEMPQKYRIDTGDILFSWSGNPDTSIDTFVWSYSEAWLNQHIFRVDPTAARERSFVLLALKYLRPTFVEIARDKQTTGLGHVTVADLKRLRFVKPHPAVLEQWNKLADKLVERAFTAQQKAQTLIELRDTLLPRLISGKLRLPEVEATIEESTA